MASNETVQGPLPSVRAAIEKATDGINRYPDNGYDLEPAPSTSLWPSGSAGLAPEHVAVGCGSVSLCQQLSRSPRRGRRGGVRLAQLRDLPAAGPPRRRHR